MAGRKKAAALPPEQRQKVTLVFERVPMSAVRCREHYKVRHITFLGDDHEEAMRRVRIELRRLFPPGEYDVTIVESE